MTPSIIHHASKKQPPLHPNHSTTKHKAQITNPSSSRKKPQSRIASWTCIHPSKKRKSVSSRVKSRKENKNSHYRLVKSPRVARRLHQLGSPSPCIKPGQHNTCHNPTAAHPAARPKYYQQSSENDISWNVHTWACMMCARMPETKM